QRIEAKPPARRKTKGPLVPGRPPRRNPAVDHAGNYRQSRSCAVHAIARTQAEVNAFRVEVLLREDLVTGTGVTALGEAPRPFGELAGVPAPAPRVERMRTGPESIVGHVLPVARVVARAAARSSIVRHLIMLESGRRERRVSRQKFACV